MRDVVLEHQPDFFSIEDAADFSLVPVLGGDMFRELTQYPVIVEGWAKRQHGLVGRNWVSQFTKEEREEVGKWHAAFHKWHIQTGTPKRIAISLKTLELLQRAAAFFAQT